MVCEINYFDIYLNIFELIRFVDWNWRVRSLNPQNCMRQRWKPEQKNATNMNVSSENIYLSLFLAEWNWFEPSATKRGICCGEIQQIIIINFSDLISTITAIFICVFLFFMYFFCRQRALPFKWNLLISVHEHVVSIVAILNLFFFSFNVFPHIIMRWNARNWFLLCFAFTVNLIFCRNHRSPIIGSMNRFL